MIEWVLEFSSGPGGDGIGGAADVPGGRGDVESEVEEEETICREAGGRVALRCRLVCEQELGGRGGGGGGGGG